MDPIEPMLARTVDTVPTGDGLLYEPKWDGFRALAQSAPVTVQSKSGRLLQARFPEIAEALRAQMPDGVLRGIVAAQRLRHPPGTPPGTR